MIDRREFLKGVEALGVMAAVPLVGSRPVGAGQLSEETGPVAPAADHAQPDPSEEEVLRALEQKAREALGPAGNCAQASFAILQEHFGLPGEEIHRALSTLPGIGFRGDTCGAVVGSLMALNLRFGYVAGDEPQKRRAGYLKAREFLARFEEDRGTATCRGIHEAATGRWHDLMDPAEAKAYGEAGGGEACRTAVATGVRIAAELITEGTDTSTS